MTSVNNCECLVNLAKQASVKHNQNGYDACVQVWIKGVISIAPFVLERSPYEVKCIRLAKHRKSEGIEFNYCPICGCSLVGNRYNKSLNAQVWENDLDKPIAKH